MAGALFYAVGAIAYRLIGINFGIFYVTLTRNIIMFVIAIIVVLTVRQWMKIDRNDIRWFALLGISGALANATFFVALNLLPIGTALFFLYAFATLASLVYGVLFFRERMTKFTAVGFFLGIGGLAVLFSETMRYAPLLFIAIACLAGILEATWNIFSKKISLRYPLPQILAMDSSIAAFATVPLILVTGEQMHAPALTAPWIAVFASAVTVLAGSYLIILGYRSTEAHRGSILLLLEVVFGSIFAYFLFHEGLSLPTILGGALIGAGVVAMHYNNRP